MAAKVTKKQIDEYTIKLPEMGGWAKITVSEDGTVSIVSDYGNWGYVWSHHGRESIKHFLVGIDSWYTWNKFSGKTVLNIKNTIKNMKKEIRSESNKDEREILFFQLEEIEECRSINDIYNYFYYNDNELTKFFDPAYLPISEDQDPQFMMFYKRLWKPFIRVLKKEINQKSLKLTT